MAKRVKDALIAITEQLQEEGVNIRISPETTGRPTQFGTYEEILKLASDIDGVGICIDFAHLHARTNGKYNSYDEFTKVLSRVEHYLGREGLDNTHIHMSGILYGPKGEKKHIPLMQSDMKIDELLRAWKDFNIKGYVISESPLPEEDALLMKKKYLRMG